MNHLEIEILEIASRWILGLQLIFWGLNGFFNWKQIPPSDPRIERFVQACIEIRFLMPTVKCLEIIFGVILLTGYGTVLALVGIAPILFVICGLHILFNKHSGRVVMPLALPYLIALMMNGAKFGTLFMQ